MVDLDTVLEGPRTPLYWTTVLIGPSTPRCNGQLGYRDLGCDGLVAQSYGLHANQRWVQRRETA